MKHLSFFFLNNSMGSKMKTSIRNMCNNHNSTSTLNQHHNNNTCYNPSTSSSSQLPTSSSSCMVENDQNAPPAPPRKSITLEEMILQLDLEEEMARKEKAMSYQFDNQNEKYRKRMSCVNSSDILRSAKNALNQYPRFSLDGRDSMYKASFRPSLGPSIIDGLKLGRILHLPQSIGGESVIWCKPGVVPKLMGLDAMPIPISRINNNNNNYKHKNDKHKVISNMIIRNQNLRQKTERKNSSMRRHVINCGNRKRTTRGSADGCTLNGYCVMNPIAFDPVSGLGGPITWSNPHNCT